MLKVRGWSLRSLSKGALGRTLGSFGVKRIFDLGKNSEIYDPMTLGASTNYGCSLWHLGFSPEQKMLHTFCALVLRSEHVCTANLPPGWHSPVVSGHCN